VVAHLTGDDRGPAKGQVRSGGLCDHVEVRVIGDGGRRWAGYVRRWSGSPAVHAPACSRQ
jgi:hypothetical protein